MPARRKGRDLKDHILTRIGSGEADALLELYLDDLPSGGLELAPGACYRVLRQKAASVSLRNSLPRYAPAWRCSEAEWFPHRWPCRLRSVEYVLCLTGFRQFGC